MSKRAKIRIVSYLSAALLVLSLFSAASYGRLRDYRRQAAVDADRAFRETVGAVDRLSRSLEKSLYAADGGMCGKVCAEICADARAAETAMAALPFSTVELEQSKGFVGLTGDYAYTLCRQAAEQGFTEEQRQNLASLSASASQLAGALDSLAQDLADGLVEMDKREKELENVGLDEDVRLLSAELGSCEAAFRAPEPFDYDGLYAPKEPEELTPVSEQATRAMAARLLGAEPAELTLSAEYAGGGRRSYSLGSVTVSATAQGVESLNDSRLVSEERIGAEEAQRRAEEFLAARGYEGLSLEESAQRGSLLELSYAAAGEDVTHLDRALRITVALDDGSIYAFDAAGLAGETAAEWPLSREEAEALLPPGLSLEGARKVSYGSEGGRSVACWELKCRNEEGRAVTIYFCADSGKQQEIVLGPAPET